MTTIVGWNDTSEALLISGVVGSFFALIIGISSITFIFYNIFKKNGTSDIEISETSSMVMSRSGKHMLRFVISGLIVFLLPPISFAFLKSNVITGDNSNPFDYCELSWFLEYFGYEVGKLLISIFLIYRLYSSFDNSLYHIPKKYITYTFFIFIPLLMLIYVILVLLAIFLPDKQFGLIVTLNKGYIYCGYNHISVVFVFCHCTSFIREIGFGSFILYTYISRLHAMNIHAKEIKMTSSKKAKTKTNKKKKKSTNKKTSKKSGKKSPNQKSTETLTQQKGKKKAPKVIELDNDFVSDDDDEEEAKKKSMTKDLKFNMQNRRSLIIRYVILIVIMMISSFSSQILLCIMEYPSFYVSFDIILHTVCLTLILWFSQSIWKKIVNTFYCICLCKYCCPVMDKTDIVIKSET